MEWGVGHVGSEQKKEKPSSWPPIKSGPLDKGRKRATFVWPHLAYPLLTNISWYSGNIVSAHSKFTCTFKFLNEIANSDNH